jgi:phospholipase/lecithinase/hemolysin
MKNNALVALLAMLCAFSALSCSEEKITESLLGGEPGSGSPGSFSAAKFVSIGNSITAGFLSGSLYESGQKNSFPYLIARQAHGTAAADTLFQMPLIAEPGFGAAVGSTLISGRVELGGFSSTGSPITLTNASPIGNGQSPPANPAFLNVGLSRPYNNLGIPGTVVADATIGITTSNSASRSAFLDIILRNPTLGNLSPVQQARLLAPTFVTFWLGNNDVLGYATSGGVNPSAPTTKATFELFYKQAIDSLKQIPNVKIALLNIPDVTSIPFATTIGPLLRTAYTVGKQLGRIPASSPGAFYYRRGVNPINSALPFDTTALMTTNDMGNPNSSTGALVLLTGSTAASALGSTTNPAGATWRSLLGAYRNNPSLAPFFAATSPGSSQEWQVFRTTFFSPALDTTKPFGLDPAHPIPNQWVLDRSELNIARQAVIDFNTFIASQVGGAVVGLVDINKLFNDIVANRGITVDGERLSATFVTGGLFSMDGVHPSPKAHGIVANELIAIINREFGASIPLVQVRNLSNGVVLASESRSSTQNIGEAFESAARAVGAFRQPRQSER